MNYVEFILATFGGILIAVISSYVTILFTEVQKKKTAKVKYQDMLNALSVEIRWQQNQLKILNTTIEDVKIVCIKCNAFVINNPITFIDSSFLETCVLKVIDFDRSAIGLAALLTTYKNQIKNIEYYLTFNNAQELIRYLEKEEEIKSEIEEYFNILESEYLNKAQFLAEKIQNLIKSDLIDYPKTKLIN